MHLGLLLALLHQPTTPPPAAIAKVEVTPTGGELEIGQTLKVSARALDANGQPVTMSMIRFFVGSDNGQIVDSTGELTAGYAGPLRVVAVAFIPGQPGQTMGEAGYRARPQPPPRAGGAPQPAPAARGGVDPMPPRLVVGTQLTLVATPFSKHGDRRSDAATFTSSASRVVTVTPDGILHAVSPGRARVTAAAGPANTRLNLQVVPSTITRLTLDP